MTFRHSIADVVDSRSVAAESAPVWTDRVSVDNRARGESMIQELPQKSFVGIELLAPFSRTDEESSCSIAAWDDNRRAFRRANSRRV